MQLVLFHSVLRAQHSFMWLFITVIHLFLPYAWCEYAMMYLSTLESITDEHLNCFQSFALTTDTIMDVSMSFSGLYTRLGLLTLTEYTPSPSLNNAT